jgi:hypothetical protein
MDTRYSPPPSFSLTFLGFYFRWDAFVPLHRLWLGYMSELLGLGPAPPQKEGGKGPSLSASAPTPALPQPAGTIHAKLIKADFHGSIMTGESFSLLCALASRVRGGGERRRILMFMDGFGCDGRARRGIDRLID